MLPYQTGTLKKMDCCFAKMTTGPDMEKPVSNAARFLNSLQTSFTVFIVFFLQVITGPVMVAGEHKFHPECFCCCSCSAFIGDGDSYALVERSKLYWYVRVFP